MSTSEEQHKMPGNGISLEPNVATSNEKAAESVEYNIAFEEILKDDKSVSSSSSSDDDDIPQCQKCCPKCCNKHFAGAVECGDCLCGCRIEIRDWYRRTDFKGWFKQKLSWENAKHHFPILAWVPKYKLKYIQGDAIAGITVGLTVYLKAWPTPNLPISLWSMVCTRPSCAAMCTYSLELRKT